MEKCSVIFNPFNGEYLQSFINGELIWTNDIGQCYLFVNDQEFNMVIEFCGNMEEYALIEIKTVYYNG